MNRVQRLRKDAGLEVSDRIRLAVQGSEGLVEALEDHRDFIARETLARTYDSPGSEIDLAERGLVPSGALDGPKARLLLALLLAALDSTIIATALVETEHFIPCWGFRAEAVKGGGETSPEAVPYTIVRGRGLVRPATVRELHADGAIGRSTSGARRCAGIPPSASAARSSSTAPTARSCRMTSVRWRMSLPARSRRCPTPR